jgi:ABC-type amino acid transport substrate-binding protein
MSEKVVGTLLDPSTPDRQRHRWPWVPLLALLVIASAVAALPAPPPSPAPPVADVQPAHVWQPGVLRVGIDAAYPPFASERDARFSGHDVELSQRLADHLGLRLELVNIPFDGLYDALRVSRIDVIISALPYQEELDGTVIYSRPYFQAGEVLVADGSRALPDPRRLVGLRVGAELGSLGDQAARQLVARGAGIELNSSFRSLDQALAALASGAVDVVAVDRVSALQRQAAEPRLRLLEPGLTNAPYVIAVPYDAADLARSIDQWLEARERDGTLAQLTLTYLRS